MYTFLWHGACTCSSNVVHLQSEGTLFESRLGQRLR